MQFLEKALAGLLNQSKTGLLVGLAVFAAGIAGARADVVKTLQGVWVWESGDCAKVFEKKGGHVQFKDRTYAHDRGFIISGNKGKGPVGGTCAISQVQEEGDRFSAQLSCADAVVSRNMTWSFRIIDPTHFERFDGRETYRYKKCSF